MTTAVLAVDLQVVYSASDGGLARSGVDVTPNSAAVQRCRDVLHSARAAGIPVVLTRKITDEAYATGVSFGRLGDSLIRRGGLSLSGADAQLVPGIHHQGDIVVDKLGYSAFSGTRLDSTLRALGVDSLIVMGLTTAICVESTVRAAADHRYRVRVVRDAVAEHDERRHLAALEAMAYAFATLTTATAVVDGWSAMPEETL